MTPVTPVPVDLGVQVADAEDVAVQYAAGTLVVTFVDWRDRPQRLAFDGVLAFRACGAFDALCRRRGALIRRSPATARRDRHASGHGAGSAALTRARRAAWTRRL